MRKKIMILGASILQLPAIEKAQSLGLDVVVVDMDPNAIGFKVEGVKKEIISTIDIPEIVKVAISNKIDGIMTLATDMPMRSVAAVAKVMDLVGIDENTAIKATNKYEMRAALETAGVPIPRYFKVRNEREYNEAIKALSVPFIVKPVDSSGSRGIFEVIDYTDEKLIEEAYKYCKPFSGNGDIIVEEYMSGPEVSVETFSIDGICHVIQITDKITTGAPHYVEMGHSQPTKFSKDIADSIIKVAQDANHAIGIKNGPSHTEIIITDAGPKIVELGARLGGDNITTHLVPLSTGVDMVKCCIQIALGEKPNIEPIYNKGSAIKYFHQRDGIIMNIENVEKAEKMRGIKQISFVHGIGEKITDVINSGARMGFVIAQDDTVEEALNDCEKVLRTVEITIR